MPLPQRLGQVGPGHLPHQLGEGHGGGPAEPGPGARGVAAQVLHLGGTVVGRVHRHQHVPRLHRRPRRLAGSLTPQQGLPESRTVHRGNDSLLLAPGPAPIERHPQLGERRRGERPHGVAHPGGDDVVGGRRRLEHAPHGVHVVAGVAPVAPGVEVPEQQPVLQPQGDAAGGAGDLARDERLAAARALVVEEDPAAGEQAVRLAVVHRDPVGVELGRAVGGARVERRGLALGHLPDPAEHLARGRLVEPHPPGQPQQPDRFQQPERPQAVGVARVLGGLERHLHVALRRQVVDLVGLHLLHQPRQVGRVGHVAVVQVEARGLQARVVVQVVHPLGVQRRRPPLDPVHLVALRQEQLRQVRPVLPRHARDHRPLHGKTSCEDTLSLPRGEGEGKGKVRSEE